VGAIQIEGDINGTPISVDLDTVSARADSQLEQVQHIQGAISATGAGLTAGTTQTTGNQSTSSSADDDPATPSVLAYDSKTLPGGSSSTLSQGIGGISVDVSRTGASSGATTSAVAAGQPAPGGGTQTCPTTTPPGAETDAAACGHDWSHQQEALSAQLALGSLGLGTSTLASLAAAAESTRVHVDRDPTTTDGTLGANAVRSFGELRLAGLPTGVPPPVGWLGYWVRVTPYRDTINVETGDNTNAPTASVTSGSVQVWNGLGYTNVSIGGGADLTIPPVNLVDLPAGLNLVDVSISGSVRTGTLSTQDPDGPGSGIERTEASASATSPVIADIDYNLSVTPLIGPPILDVSLTISVDLGSLSAQADYRESAVD
jgi:hypothetical protein